VAENLAQARTLIEAAHARGARLVALPENFSFMGLKDADKRAHAEADGSGPVQEFLATTAARLKLWIVGGTVPLRAGADGRVAAASLVYDADGRRAGRYDKIHLFDVDIPGRTESYRESAHVAAGAQPAVIDTPVGRLGLSVCYDVRFPELYRHLSAAGAQLLLVPSAFTGPTGRAHWETLLRARAIENLCYVIAPAQSGFHPSGRETYGDSMIVDFWGRILQRVPRGTGCAIADVDLPRQTAVRQSFPALAHRAFAEGMSRS
jgi:nitrilase